MLSYAFINTPIPLEHHGGIINSGSSHSLLQMLNIYVWFYMSDLNQYLSYKLDFKIPWERNKAMLLYILSGASSKWQLKKYAQSKLFECTQFWMNSTGKICWKHKCWSRWKAGWRILGCGLFFLYSVAPYISLLCGTSHNACIQRCSIIDLWRNTTYHGSSVFCLSFKSVESVFNDKARLAVSLFTLSGDRCSLSSCSY